MADRWKTAFKSIHGKTPTKADYSLAPKNVQAELGSSQTPEKLITNPKKRSRFALRNYDELSPLKKRFRNHSMLKATASECPKANEENKHAVNVTTPKPLMKLNSNKFLLTTVASPSKLIASPIKLILNRSPRKTGLTPEHPSTSNFATSITRTPIRSPRKPLVRPFILRNTENLLLGSNKKFLNEPEEEKDEFEDETSVIPDDTANQKSRAKKNLFRNNAKREKAKAHGENFVKINMRKKNFVRGKMSADAKRKMIKKQKWKAKFGGKRF